MPSFSNWVRTDLIYFQQVSQAVLDTAFNVRIRGSGYTVSAVPVQFAKTGRRCFYSDETGVIHQNWGAEPATVNSRLFN